MNVLKKQKQMGIRTIMCCNNSATIILMKNKSLYVVVSLQQSGTEGYLERMERTKCILTYEEKHIVYMIATTSHAF